MFHSTKHTSLGKAYVTLWKDLWFVEENKREGMKVSIDNLFGGNSTKIED